MKKAIFTKRNKTKKNNMQDIPFDKGICPTIETIDGVQFYRGRFIPENLISPEVSNLLTWIYPDDECNVHTDVTKDCGKRNREECLNCIVRKENRQVFANYRQDIMWKPKIGDSVWKIKYNVDIKRWKCFKSPCNEFNVIASRYSTMFRTREQARKACSRLHAIMQTPNGKLLVNAL
jgi:hypothetical protein